MKHIVIILFVIIIYFLGSNTAKSQSLYHFDIEYHYNLGVSETIVGKSFGRDKYKMGGSALRLTARYDIAKQWSLGMGVGVERYTEIDINTMPIFASLRYKPIEDKNFYVFSNIGYSIKVASDYHNGFTGRLGLGYSINVAKHFKPYLQVAYNLNNFRGIETISYNANTQQTDFFKSNSTRHSVSFGIGFTF